MTLDQIKTAVDAGKQVCWKNEGYRVICDSLGQYLIVFRPNEYTVGLTNREGYSLNGQPRDFYILEETGEVANV